MPNYRHLEGLIRTSKNQICSFKEKKIDNTNCPHSQLKMLHVSLSNSFNTYQDIYMHTYIFLYIHIYLYISIYIFMCIFIHIIYERTFGKSTYCNAKFDNKKKSRIDTIFNSHTLRNRVENISLVRMDVNSGSFISDRDTNSCWHLSSLWCTWASIRSGRQVEVFGVGGDAACCSLATLV